VIAAETLVVDALRGVGPEISLGVAYLLGVLVVLSVCGMALGAAAGVLGAAAFDCFRSRLRGTSLPLTLRARMALVIFSPSRCCCRLQRIELGAAVGGERSVGERVVASVRALLRAARDWGMGSAVER
jgi:hypothetical protein